MATLVDAFTGNIFNVVSLSAAVDRLPYTPTKIQTRGIFEVDGITTTTVMVEERNGSLALIPATRRGAPGIPIKGDKRTARHIEVVHLAGETSVYADDVLNLRAFGSATAEETVGALVARRLAEVRIKMEVTQEYHRAKALQGIVYDSDGSTVLYNLYTEFGVAEQTTDIALSVATTDVRDKCVDIARQVEDALGAQTYTGLHGYAGADFFDALVGHAKVDETLKYYEAGARDMQRDLRQGFMFGGIMWEEYRATVSTQAYFPADEARVFPTGVAGMYKSLYAPADYIETVGSMGQEFYAKSWNMEADKGVKIEVQTNPLHIVTYPAALIKVTKS